MDVITTHINADFDCLGAMVAARKLYPEAEMVFPGAQERNLREFFVKSTIYAYNFKRIRDIDLDAITRLILVDVSQSERIGPFAEVAGRKGVDVHIYDHHPVSAAMPADFSLIEEVGSTVTIMSHLFMEKGITPNQDEATLMMLGLYEDTGSLMFNSTTEKDYAAASFLLSCGANLNTVGDFLTQELTADQVSLLHDLLENHTVLTINGIDISVAHASAESFVGDLAVLAHKLKDMENLNALLVVARMHDRIFMVGRSRIPEVDVGEILAEFGGGGHAYAASGTVRDQTLVQVLDRLPQVLRKHLNPSWQARHLMSSPVKHVGIGVEIRQAREILNRFNLNALPVVDEGQVVGMISRQTADKAAHHRLDREPVRDYMTQEVTVVAPDAPVDALQELIVGHGQRIVPVVDDTELVGVITRTDLLRHMVSGGHSNLPSPSVDIGGYALRRKHLVRMLRDRLPQRVQELLQQFGQVGDELGVNVYAVGGFVRDLLLHQENLDVDIVVEGDGIVFARACAEKFDCRIRYHEKFGTAVIIYPDGFKVDVASTRMEYYLEPGALPNVEYASIKLDLYRRDFTINTLALALNSEQFGELLDFFQAQKDIREKLVRVLHNLSFVEDPTRVFRAIRFEQRLGFQLGPHTESLLRSAVRMGFVDKVGGQRLFNELKILFREAYPLASVKRMSELGLLACLHPALKWQKNFRDIFTAAGRAIHWHELLYTGKEIRPWLVYLLCMLSPLRGREVTEFCKRHGVPPRIRKLLIDERSQAYDILRRMNRRKSDNPPRNSDLYRWLYPFEVETLLYMMARSSDRVRQWISHYYTHLRDIRTSLDGNALKKLGLKPGPGFKTMLQQLHDAKLNGRVADREEELAFLRKRFRAEFAGID